MTGDKGGIPGVSVPLRGKDRKLRLGFRYSKLKVSKVSVPLRGKDRKLHKMGPLLLCAYYKFPSPCGEKIENYFSGLINKVMTHFLVSVPLRGKDRKLPPLQFGSSSLCLERQFPSPCGEKIENYL
jgi:hypothetical protein